METIQLIKLSDIVKNPYQPRVTFDEKKLQELSDSIKENGVLQPIIVRKSSIIGYEILAGERRFRASQLADLSEIPAIIRILTDDEMMTLSILENLQRDDLTVLDEARSLQNLATKQALTHAQIAKKLGKSRPYVTNLIRLLNLPETILQMIDDKKLSQAHARLLVSVENSNYQLLLAKRIIDEQLSVRTLEKILSNLPAKTVSKPKNIFIKESEENLAKIFGNPVTIKAKKIEISYDNLDELNRLILILTHK
ncbi:chromosome partitioning protein ParB [Lactococcus hodotermopsidis]|uniref:Chromosome partitioning protein ParB n=1 Tax=Pseudolactococcus hodotermopsidis TaxID=2709157 RepID=A0A6A0BAV0_9LACT|nr:ParB/RepB/Spo0J family partition protein [Lactococcus hodotermopsidis]GFH41588.1 chromosome partitioning protein ParB [Lactococcus hodotermopsidis]